MNYQELLKNLIPRFLSRGIKIAGLLATAYLVNRFLEMFFGRIVSKKIKDKISAQEKVKRVETLTSVFRGTIRFIIWIIVLLMVLPEFGVNIAPILTSLGLIGLAVGMAARDIIADFISGFFILLEDQYHIGDKVKIVGIEGTVKEITLRRTIVKDEEGILHLIPNSQIKIVSKTHKGDN